MKKIAGIVLLIFSLCLVLNGQQTEAKPKVGFLIANFIDIRWYKDKAFFEEKVKEIGGTPIVRDASNNPKKQLEQAQELIDLGATVLVVIPVEAKSAGEIIDLAHKNNVTVIAYDRLIMDTDLDYYISFNSIKVGEYMTEYLLKKKPSGKYAVMNGPMSDHNSILINEGVMNILQPKVDNGDIELVYHEYMDEWIELNAFLAMDQYLESNAMPDAIITGADIFARGILMSLDSKDLSGKILLTGQNSDLQAIQDILAGRQTMTIYKSLRLLGETAAEVAMKIAMDNGDDIDWDDIVSVEGKEIPSILFDPVVVDKNNIRKTVIADGHLTEEEVFGE